MGRLFGTDGVRGIANRELTHSLALEIGRAAGAVITQGSRRRPKFVVGMDTRMSSDMLFSAVAAGLCSVGSDVLNLGVIPTPAVAFLVVKYKADAGIMISASHNPAEFNGIKIFSGDGYKLPDELEERIEAVVLDKTKDLPSPIGGDVGKVYFMNDAVKDYVTHLKSTVPYSLEGLNIAVDCSNGSAYKTAKILFSTLGANAHILFDEPDGENINDNCGSTHIERLSEYVVENHLDCGVAFDGDADRCLCVDENGTLIDGDQIMAICALDLKERGKLNKNAVVGTIMTNFGFTKFCEENQLHYVATKVGDRYVLEEMVLEDYDFGGEQSGHVIFRDFATTGDGQLTAIQLLCLIHRSEKKLSELAKVMTKSPQVTINLKITSEDKPLFYTNLLIREAIESAKAAFGREGRIVVRPSGTEPLIRIMAEGDDREFIELQARTVADVITRELGKAN